MLRVIVGAHRAVGWLTMWDAGPGVSRSRGVLPNSCPLGCPASPPSRWWSYVALIVVIILLFWLCQYQYINFNID
jgi:hypothetical protein